jgi:hypothetical protein
MAVQVMIRRPARRKASPDLDLRSPRGRVLPY